MGYLVTILGAYLLGCSNMALYLGRLTGTDVLSRGSCNPGASNATILMGWRAGILVGIHDIGKAFLAVMLARICFPGLEYIGAIAGVSCVLGHIFPFYLKFRGGKGFASYLGMALALNWKLALLLMAAVVIVTLITDYIVIGTALTTITFPVWMGFAGKSLILGLILCTATVVILYKHRMNFVRIAQGTEIGLRSAARGDHRPR